MIGVELDLNPGDIFSFLLSTTGSLFSCFQQFCFEDEPGDTVCQLHLNHVDLDVLPCCHVAASRPGDKPSSSCPGYISLSSPYIDPQKVGLVSSLMVTTISYGMGVGAVPYTMIGELFTPEHRTLGSCLAQVVRWVFATL